MNPIGPERLAIERCHAVALEAQTPGTQSRVECCTPLQRRRQGGHQHRLLGIGRATHAAVAKIPTALDVALNMAEIDAKFFGTTNQDIVVGIGRHIPGTYRKLALHRRKPRIK